MRLRTLAAPLTAAALVAAGPALAQSAGGPTPLADDATLIALAVSLACADAPEGEAPRELPPPAPPAPGGPELELVATVRAKTLRFERVPKVRVDFRGNGRRTTVWRTERVNLPMRPQPGVDYRDVQVRLTVSTTIEDLAALLSDAQRASAGIALEPADPDPVKPAAAPAAAAPAAPAAKPSP